MPKIPCVENKASIIFDFVTDTYGHEMSWELIDLKSEKVIRMESGYASQTFYSYEFCLDCSSYQLRVLDSYGDGMNGGDYGLEVDGELIIYKTGSNFGYEDVLTFSPTSCQRIVFNTMNPAMMVVFTNITLTLA